MAVVIPTFDRAELVCRALLGVSAQTRPPDRVVVVDDGSTDDTAERVAREFPGVHVIVQNNAGVSAARNRGVAACDEEWIAFLDADDEWKPEKLQRQLEEIERNPASASAVHCDEIWIRRGNQVLQRNRHQKRGGRMFEDCLPLCAISPSAVLLRRSVLNQLGGFDETLPACEDYDLWLRLTARFDVLYVDEPLVVKYGGHDDQLSRRFPVMDRFRIKALAGFLSSTACADLTLAELRAAQTVLEQKVRIVANGARKRGRADEASSLEALASAALEASNAVRERMVGVGSE